MLAAPNAHPLAHCAQPAWFRTRRTAGERPLCCLSDCTVLTAISRMLFICRVFTNGGDQSDVTVYNCPPKFCLVCSSPQHELPSPHVSLSSLCCCAAHQANNTCGAGRVDYANNILCGDCKPKFAEVRKHALVCCTRSQLLSRRCVLQWSGVCVDCSAGTNVGYVFLFIFLSARKHST
jgi:hypothetical protein